MFLDLSRFSYGSMESFESEDTSKVQRVLLTEIDCMAHSEKTEQSKRM